MKAISKLFSALLVCSMIILSVPPAFAAEPSMRSTQETQVENPEMAVRVIIELTQQPLLASETAQSLGAGAYFQTPEAAAARAELLDVQQTVKDEILSIDGDVVFYAQYTNTVNGFAAQVKRGDVAKIKALSGVKAVYADVMYNAPEETYQPQLMTSTDTVGAKAAWNLLPKGYKGEGTVVAVIDTGVDVSHETMVLSDSSKAKMDETYIADILSSKALHAEEIYSSQNHAELTAANVYSNEKFPFCFDYADNDADANADGITENGDHGVQIVGAIAANGTAAKAKGVSLHSAFEVNGVAPEAQIVGMKIFSSSGGGAPTSTSIMAVEDATALGVDVICLSFGSVAGFTMYEGLELKSYEQAYSFALARKAGILVCASVGNSGRIGTGGARASNSYPSTSNPDIGLVNSPATKYHATAVAGADNKTSVEPYMTAGDYKFTFKDGFDSTTDSFSGFVTDFSGRTLEYVDCGMGQTTDFEGKDLSGKLALVQRGGNTFAQKLDNSAAAGAIGVLVYNNIHGIGSWLTPNISGAEASIPLVLIEKEAGETLKSAETKSVTIDTAYTEFLYQRSDETAMDYASSWGCTTDLKLKPELTAPGSNVYTTSIGDRYVSAAGTSVACAQAAGAAAIMQQYVQENSGDEEKFSPFTQEQKASIIESLLMSTADILVTTDHTSDSCPVSPRQQGAGLLNLVDAVKSDVYLLNISSGKAKVELGDQVLNGSLPFEVEFQAYNLSDTPISYKLGGSVLTDCPVSSPSAGWSIAPYSYELLTKNIQFEPSNTITVEAWGKTSIKATITLDAAQVNELKGIYDNGFFLEGFIKLTSIDTSFPNLSIPYMGFSGDWTSIPILDGSGYFQNYFNGDDSRNYFYGLSRPYSLRLDADGNPTDTRDVLGGNDAGSKFDEEWIAFSPNGDREQDTMGYEAFLLRSAKKLTVSIKDSSNHLVKALGEELYLKKYVYDAQDSQSGTLLPEWDGTDSAGQSVPDGSYHYVISATLDYPDAPSQNTSIPVICDTVAPTLADVQLDTSTMTLTGTAAESTSYLSCLEAKSVTSGAVVRDALATPAKTHNFSLDLSSFPQGEITLTVYDVAGNHYTMTGINPPPPVYNDNSGGGAPSVTVPASSDEGSAKVSATVSGGRATISATDTQIKEIISSDKNTGTVKVDASALKVDEAVIPAKLVNAAATATGSEGLEVLLSTGSVTLDKTALESVGNKSITVSVEGVKPAALTTAQKETLGEQADTAVVVDINVLVNGVKTSNFNGSVISVSVPYTPKAGEDTSKLVVWYLADDGSIEAMNGKYNAATKCFEFTTTHLSTYVLVSFPFTDVAAGSYYYDAVVWAVAKNITQGTGAATFSPAASCTRGQMAAFLWHAAGNPEPATAVNPFNDVKTDAHYYKAVLWAVEQGITLGANADGTAFNPNGVCTRGQMATFLYRYAGSPAVTESNPFTDVAASDYCHNAVIWAATEGVTQGSNTAGTTFSPKEHCTRAQIVTFLYRHLSK